MKNLNYKSIITASAISLAMCLAGPVSAIAAGPAAVNLGTSGNFAILAKTGVSTTGSTSVIGDIGVSPAAATYITGFALTLPAASAFATSALVTGKIYAPGYANPTPVNLTAAVGDMQTAYTDAAGRTSPTATELGAGNIGGMTLAPGLYKWGTGVIIPTDVTLSGGANDVWVFQVAQNLNVSSGVKIILAGGAQASNIFWQVAGQTTVGTTAVFNGNILDQTAIVLNTGAILNGRALAQTAVTLDSNSVIMPTYSAPAPVVTCTPNWTCGWGSCVNGYQSQIATDSNNCGLPSSSANIACTALAQACGAAAITSCTNLYWFDSTNTTCQSQRQFCGAYMYQGLQTFNSQQACLSAAGTRQTPASSLSNSQVQSIIGLLQSFGADEATIANVQTSLSGGTPNIAQKAASGIPAGFAFTRGLGLGSVGLDVTYLKIILAQQGCFTASTSNTAVGPLTQAGIKCLQAKFGISQAGVIGPITMAKLNVLLSALR